LFSQSNVMPQDMEEGWELLMDTVVALIKEDEED
jgi:hypothetical protein